MSERPDVVTDGDRMSEEVTPVAAVGQPIVTERTVPWVNRGSRAMTRPMRMVKMLKPRCNVCKGTSAEWWKTCRHDPYEHTTTIEEEVFTTEAQPDGSEIILDRKTVLRRVKAPNIIEVPYEKKVNSALGVAAARAKGCISLPEGGYQPVCEFAGCYESNPKVETRLGKYCQEHEARLVAARVRGLRLSLDNSEYRNQQLESIAL